MGIQRTTTTTNYNSNCKNDYPAAVRRQEALIDSRLLLNRKTDNNNKDHPAAVRRQEALTNSRLLLVAKRTTTKTTPPPFGGRKRSQTRVFC